MKVYDYLPAGSFGIFRDEGVKRILVVEDDPAVQRALRRLFESEDFQVEITADGKAGLEACRSSAPAAVVLDLRLPGIPGNDVCREIKRQAPSLPVIVLSAKTDDYVTKPFSPQELLARVRAALRRRSQADLGEMFVFGNVTVDFARMAISRNGQSVSMTAQEFKLLRFFAQNPERVIARNELLNEVWGYQDYPSTRTVDNHVWKLRLKLEDEPDKPVHFLTVHGAGYKFVI